jgi:hypothetical protein
VRCGNLKRCRRKEARVKVGLLRRQTHGDVAQQLTPDYFMEEKAYLERITDEWLVDEVLQRYPSTSVIFLQYGPASRTRPGRLFSDYPRMNLQEYAELRGVSLELLLRSLNAAAETERFVRRNSWILSERHEPEVSPGIRAVKRKSQHAAAGMDCGATE